MYVHLFTIAWKQEGRLSPNFQGAQGWFYAQQFGEGIQANARKLAFFVFHGTGRCANAGRLGTAINTGQAIGACTGIGAQYTDAIETGIDADRPTHILHMGVESGGLGRAKSRMGLPT